MAQERHRDRVLIYRDEAGEWRWHRRNGNNNNIVSDSGEGYSDLIHTIDMAFEVNGGSFEVLGPDGQVIDRPSEKREEGTS